MHQIFTLFVALSLSLTTLGQAPEEILQLRPTGHINDYAGLIPDAQQARLEATLRRVDSSGRGQICVLTLDNTADYPELTQGARYQFCQELFQRWGIGHKTADDHHHRDDGVLLLIAPSPVKGKGAMRIHVGYGMESTLTDVWAKRLQEEKLVPLMKAGDPAGAIVAFSNATLAALKADQPTSSEAIKQGTSSANDEGNGTALLWVCFSVLAVAGTGLAIHRWNQRIGEQREAAERLSAERARSIVRIRHHLQQLRDFANRLDANITDAVMRGRAQEAAQEINEHVATINLGLQDNQATTTHKSMST